MNKCSHCGTIFREDVFHCCVPQHFGFAAWAWQRDVENVELENNEDYLLHDKGGFFRVGRYEAITDSFCLDARYSVTRHQLIAVAKINRTQP